MSCRVVIIFMIDEGMTVRRATIAKLGIVIKSLIALFLIKIQLRAHITKI